MNPEPSVHFVMKTMKNGQKYFVTYRCVWCGRWFLKKSNAEKLCSPQCKLYNLREKKAKYMRGNYKKYRKKWVGTGYLSAHPRNDNEDEMILIKKEKKRLNLP